MNYKISFQEMDKLGMEKIANQPLTTLDEKRKQFQDLKKGSLKENNKQKNRKDFQ